MKLQARFFVGAMAIWTSCVDKVDLSLPVTNLPLIVDGIVTDDPGPYIVKISRAYPVDGSYYSAQGVDSASVVITDDAGGRDVLTQESSGRYVTDSLQGIIGRTYTLSVTTAEGYHFESKPETILPSGTVDRIFFEVVKRQNKALQIDEEGFNIYIDATPAPGSNHRIRWKFGGTYKVTTNPSLLLTGDPPAPPDCATNCLCCVCWVSEREESPIINNNSFVASSQLNRVFMRYIPANSYTFNNKYRVEITQMEVSQEVYDFYKGIKGQVENASSLFQPPFFELKGNVHATNTDEPVVGVFSAVALSRRFIYIYPTDLGHEFYPSEIIGACTAVAPNSSTIEPPFWQ